jgi:hypothetical protein
MKHFRYIVFATLISLIFEVKAELIIEPTNPTVCAGQSISLKVLGAETDISWEMILSEEGKAVGLITGDGPTVTYVAPNEPGSYRVMVMDSSDNAPAQATITVTPISPECQLPPPPDCEHGDHWNAAIVIHSNEGDTGIGYGKTETIEFMTDQVRQTLKARFYCDNEIYPNPSQSQDFTWEKVGEAFEWAKQQSFSAKSKKFTEQPLIVVFIGYALPGQLLLKAEAGYQPKDFLKDYQETTGNEVVIILEASYSGSFIEALKGDKRLIITSTGEQLAYYGDLGHISFTQFFFDELRKGTNYGKALQQTRMVFSQLPAPFNQQLPQLEDSTQGTLAQTWCLNQCSGELPGPTLVVRTIGEVVNPNKQIDFQVEAIQAQSVDAWVVTPQIANQMDSDGYSRQPPIQIKLREEPEASGHWLGSYNGFDIGGDYLIIFNAVDNNHEPLIDCYINDNPQANCSIRFAVDGPAMVHPTLEGNRLNIPAVAVPDGLGGEILYQTQLVKRPDSETRFELGALEQVVYNPLIQTINYNPVTYSVSLLPHLNAWLELVLPLTEPLQFELVSMPLLP